MRIIGGELGGRRIQPPSKMPHTRPTTDIAKEGLFNMLQHQYDFEGMKTLDLFGGTGCITYELASRGADNCTIIEKDPVMYSFIVETAGKLGLGQIHPVRMDVFKYMEKCIEQYDLIFAGPPYALGTIDDLPREVFKRDLLKPGGVFILEHTPRNSYKGFEWFTKERSYGTTVFSFFEKPETLIKGE
jgi:16S rRNA (guanine966-N2)-methyltransferase